jgi:tetratricopeptide (TPR) repeat protein
MRDFQKSLDCNMAALAIYTKIHKGDQMDIATVLNNIGLAYHNMGDFNSALKYYQQSLDMKKRLYKDNRNNSDVSMALSNLGRFKFLAFKKMLFFLLKLKLLKIFIEFYLFVFRLFHSF